MTNEKVHKVLKMIIALIWLVNGLYCKVLNWVPRHEMIVARVLGNNHSRVLTILIGLSEIAMAIWILSGFKSRMNALFQMVIILTMNAIEFFLAQDLLLWGRFNAMFACLLVTVIYLNEFIFNKKILPEP